MWPVIRGAICSVIGFFAAAWGMVGLQTVAGVDRGGISTFILGYVGGLIGWLLGIGIWKTWALEFLNRRVKEEETPDWRRYFRFTLDHKVIGIQYLVTFVVVFLLAGALAMVVRAELLTPTADFLGPDRYNSVMSLHGILMVAVAVAAIIGGLGNYVVPLMIGADDMAFPRLNATSFWMIPPVAVLLLAAPFAGGWDSGWTAYPPLSEVNGNGQVLFILAIITFGLSSIIGAVNSITTIITMRAKGMSWFRLPIFVWSILCASILALLITQFFAASLLLVLLDRTGGLAWFDPAKGGHVLLYQHLFWFYSHPAVYIMILPGIGVVLEVLSHLSRKPLFAYKLAVGGMLGIVGLSCVVWAHHMFTSGMSSSLAGPFMVLTELISIPTGLMFLSALGTLWRGRLWMATPMLFALAWVFNFLIGGLTGIFLADVATDLQLQDTYFVVAHFHYTIVGGMIFALFAGIYFWYPKITGRMYNETLGRVHAAWMFIGFNMVFLPMFWVGLNGMNRRVASYPEPLQYMNIYLSVAAFLLGASFFVFIGNMVWSWARGQKAPANPWRATTLEWHTSSPPPRENFLGPIEVIADPYGYGSGNGQHAKVGDGQPAGLEART